MDVWLGVERELESDLATIQEEDFERMHRVIIHNDEITPMDFVIVILQRIFQLDPLQSEHVMFVAHFEGMAYVCSLPLGEANIRVGKAHFAAQLEGYPLLFTIEPE